MADLSTDEEHWQTYDPVKWEPSLSAPDTNERSSFDIERVSRSVDDEVEVAKDNEDENHAPGLGMDPHWIDLDDVRQWVYTCDFEHGNDCNPTTPEYDGRPLWLVDVVDECIVPAGLRPYVALSYVWGQVTSSEATKDEIDKLQEKGALREDNASITVPQTIRHSMKLVHLVGQRYLWVDRLCICQDEAETKDWQLQCMGDIYSNAYLTIVAANGWDANHGLRGIKGVTDPRHLSSEMEISAYLDHIKPDNSIWYSRGWTFQELLLSRRKLVFINQMVLWECSCGVWHESTGTSGNLPGNAADQSRARNFNYVGVTPNLSLKFINMSSGPMPAYLKLVRAYNSRSLTFPEDGLAAFLGVTKRIMDAFPQGFFGGLPVANFDLALLWQPNEEVKRRWSRNFKDANAIQLPSWSWAGWEGEINVNSWNLNYPPQQRDFQVRTVNTKSLCEWKHEQGGIKVPVIPANDKDQTSRTGSRIVSRVKDILSRYGFSDEIPPQVRPYLLYTRASVVKCKFGGIIKSPPNIAAKTGLIMRRIKHAWEPNKVCGTILMTSNLSKDVSESKVWELMAISSSGTRWVSDTELKKNPGFSLMLASYPSNAGCRSHGPTGELFYNYYNVMWISTSIKGGVSRRRALGIMSIQAWGSLRPEEVDIVLG